MVVRFHRVQIALVAPGRDPGLPGAVNNLFTAPDDATGMRPEASRVFSVPLRPARAHWLAL